MYPTPDLWNFSLRRILLLLLLIFCCCSVVVCLSGMMNGTLVARIIVILHAKYTHIVYSTAVQIVEHNTSRAQRKKALHIKWDQFNSNARCANEYFGSVDNNRRKSMESNAHTHTQGKKYGRQKSVVKFNGRALTYTIGWGNIGCCHGIAIVAHAQSIM